MNRIACSVAERQRHGDGQRGQGLVEYGLILVLVSIVVVVALTALSGQLNTVFDAIKNNLTAA
ncbi:MAG: Flp family type IVb pilin [Chloroflexi bacterium]|nr:MAG: Flp family type IVb pilin [Chloroflexota bacterium]